MPAKQRRRQSDSALVLPLPRRAAAGVPGSRAPAPLIVATTVPGGGSSPTNRRTLVLTLPSSLPPRRLPACSPGARFLQTQRTHGWRRAGTWGTLPVPCCSSPAGRGTVQISAPGRVPAGSRAAFRVVAPLNTAGFRRLEPANGRKLPRCWNSFSVTHETVQMSRWNRKGRMELDTGAPGALSKSGCGRETASCSTRRFPTADNERKEKKPAPTAVYRGKLQGPLLPE